MSLASLSLSVADGHRLSRDEGLRLLRDGDLLDLATAANAMRRRWNPEPYVTFVIDTNCNYTNICITRCLFCAFYRNPGDTNEGYWHSLEDLATRIQRAVDLGATTVLCQGGHNPEIPFEWYLDFVRMVRERWPQVTPHFYSPSEIWQMVDVSKRSLPDVLQALWDAGQRTIPGGGAEVLSDRVKMKISRLKNKSDGWLAVMREAHKIGFKTTATMMYGHVETDEEIIDHLLLLRDLQDETDGFTAFIPWSFKPGNTVLERVVPHTAGGARYCRILAVSRLLLDNFAHIQASWFGEGKKAGQVGLHFGADDFGGTLIEENVLHAAKHNVETTVDEVLALIRESGFLPAQRTTEYEILRRFDPVQV
jgi:cyclic dehypoxanthinyl futalosine synthase